MLDPSIREPNNLGPRQQDVDRAVAHYSAGWDHLDDEARDLAWEITEAIERVGGRSAAAEIMGVSVATLDNYRSGRTKPKILEFKKLSRARTAAIASFFDEQRAEIVEAGGDLPKVHIRRANQDRVRLPRYDIQASAGNGSVALREDVADFMTVSRAWLSRYVPAGARIGVIEARGDSMAPTIDDGDVLFVTHDIDGDDVAGGGIFVLSVDDNLMVKRLQKTLAGDIRVISDNDRHYEAETIPAVETPHRLVVHAKVFWTGGPVRGR